MLYWFNCVVGLLKIKKWKGWKFCCDLWKFQQSVLWIMLLIWWLKSVYKLGCWWNNVFWVVRCWNVYVFMGYKVVWINGIMLFEVQMWFVGWECCLSWLEICYKDVGEFKWWDQWKFNGCDGCVIAWKSCGVKVMFKVDIGWNQVCCVGMNSEISVGGRC